MQVEIDTTVLNGFPVTAYGEVYRSSVSSGQVVSDVYLLTRSGRPARFIEKRMTGKDWNFVIDELIDSVCTN